MSTGLESIRQQLASHNEQERLTALSETLKHGQEGLDLLIAHSLKDPSETVQQSSYWILQGEKPVLTLPSNLKPSATDTITSVAITPDNNILVGGSWKKIWVWQLQTGEVSKSLEGHSHWVLSVAISPDGKKLVSSSADKTIKIWDLETGKLIHTLNGHSSWVTAVAISPDGKTIVSSSADKTIKIWNLETGKLRKTLTDKDHLCSILSLCISHDGKVIVAGATNNKITLWYLQNGKLIRTLEGHSDWVQSLIISPDNKTLISGSRDGYVKTWESKSQSSLSTKENLSFQMLLLVTIGAISIGFLSHEFWWGVTTFSVVLFVLEIRKEIILSFFKNHLPIISQFQNLECTETQSYKYSISYLVSNHSLPERENFISSAAMSPNGEILVVAGRDWVLLLNPKTGKPLHALKGCSYSKLSKIVISKIPEKIFFGQSVPISVKGFDQNNQEISIKNESVNWQTSGGEIKQGLFIAGQREGTFEIKAKLDIFEDSISITVLEPSKITRVEITPSSKTLDFGKSQQFKAEVRDQRGNLMQETVSWKVSGGGTIDQQGNFQTDNQVETVIITATVIGSQINEPIKIQVLKPSRLDAAKIIPSLITSSPGKEEHFKIVLLNQRGEKMPSEKISINHIK